MRVDIAGNLGLGVTPGSWGSTYSAFQFGTTGSLYSAKSGSDFVSLDYNVIVTASNNTYRQTDVASRYTQSGGKHQWFTAPSGTAGNAITFTQAMTLDASGRLLVGTTTAGLAANAATMLSVTSGTANTYASVRASGGEELYLTAQSGILGLYSYTNHPLLFGTNNSERARIDASGNLLVGTTSNAAITGFSGSAIGQTIQSVLPVLALVDSDNTSDHISWIANSGGLMYLNNKSANAMVFSTNNTERARITSGGETLFQTTDASDTAGIGFKINPNATAPFVSQVGSSTSNTNVTYTLYSTGAAAYRFYVGYGGTVYATNTTISAISDARYKENVRDLNIGLDAILALKPRVFDWKDGKGKNIKNDRGFIAQEFEQVFPDLIDEWKDPAPEGEAPYKSVRQDLIPVLVKAIQELTARVVALETN